jgi:PAS domain S-box-containing protein
MNRSDSAATASVAHETVLVAGSGEATDRARAALDSHAPSLAVECGDADADTDAVLTSLPAVDGVVAPVDTDGIDGIALLRSVREREPHVPFVLVGDGAPADTVEAAATAGATDVVDTSTAPPSLVATRIGNAVARGQADTAGRADTTGQSPAHEADAGIDDGSDKTTDLTALKERALDEAEMGVVISEATDDVPTIFVNEGFSRITGYDPDEFVGRNCRILQGAETDERPVRTMREAIEEGRRSTVVLKNYRKDGTEFWNEVDINPVRDDDGAVTHFLGFQRDVTERKHLEQELVTARESLRQLYAVTTDSSLSFEERVERTLAIGRRRLDVDLGFVTHLSDDTQRIVHAVGDHPLLQPGEACPLSESYCRRTLDTEGLLAVVHAAADEAWEDDPAYDVFGLECYIGGKVLVDGELYGTLCFADDEPRDEPFSESQAVFVELLTRWIGYELERRKDEHELRVAERRFNSLFDNPVTFTGVLDTDGTLREVNDRAVATLPDDASPVGDRFWETSWWQSAEAVETVRGAVERAAGGEVAQFECDYVHTAGTGTVSATIYPVYSVDDGVDDDGETVVSLMAIGTDTTRRSEQAAQLERQRDRLEEFASVVSHDLRSPLEVARGRLELYESTGDDTHLDSAHDSLDRISALIDDLLTLARQGDSVADVEPTSVTTVARQAWNTVSTNAASLAVDLDDVTVDADSSRLQQLFENLFRNAVEHGSTSSRAQSGDAVEHTTAHDDTIEIRLTSVDGGRGFAVADDGPGIPPDERDLVFDRGYTTNDEGTGFGLAIVARIAEAHGWSATVTESDAGGARFEFRFDG